MFFRFTLSLKIRLRFHVGVNHDDSHGNRLCMRLLVVIVNKRYLNHVEGVRLFLLLRSINMAVLTQVLFTREEI